MLFVKNPDLLKQLVCELIGIKLESIGEFSITNPEIPPEIFGDKFCRLDINMTVDGQRVDLEIQVRDEGDYPERVLYHWAREYSSALPEGGDYIDLPRTVIVSIINFNLFDCKEYHSKFQPLEVTRHTLLSDKMSFYFFELNKLPKEIKADDMLLLWLALFKAETEEELKKIELMEVPIMEQAIKAYHKIKTEPEFRELERLRSLARHNEAAALRHARDEEREKWQNVVADKDAEIARVVADKDAEIAQVVVDKDAEIAQVVADKDAKIADKDAEIARLREQLGKK